MRRILSFNLIFFLFAFVNAQEHINFGDSPKPEPTAAYLSNYIDIPVSLSTGIPDITIPLYTLETSNKKVNIPVALNYNIENNHIDDAAGDTGLGWTTTGKGVISRVINKDVDEIYDSSADTDYQVNSFDDVYYYTLPTGIAGKFRFNRDLTSNTFTLLSLSPNKVKIDYERTSNTATLILSSFRITDDKGIQYVFNDFSSAITTTKSKKYKSAFYLSKIIDHNNREIATYTYFEHIVNDSYQSFQYDYCKLKSIFSPNYGVIEFTYKYDQALQNSLNDPYQVTDISLYDGFGHNISVCRFTYNFKYFDYYGSSYTKRQLAVLDKNNSSGQGLSERTDIEYNSDNNLVNFIRYPNSEVVQYVFEGNDIFSNKETPEYLASIEGDIIDPDIQYFAEKNSFSYDTNISKTYTLDITGPEDKVQYIFLRLISQEKYSPKTSDKTMVPIDCIECPGEPPYPPHIDFMVKKNGYIVEGIASGNSKKYYLTPGSYQIELIGTAGGKGTVIQSEIKLKPPPYKNIAAASGYRIKEINKFEKNQYSTPKEALKFSYSDFDHNLSSSGYTFYVESADNGLYATYTLYKNVRTSNGLGRTDHYFKTPADFPESNILIDGEGEKRFRPYYSFTKSGILDKTIIYNSNNVAVASEEYSNNYNELAGSEYYKIYSNYYSKPSYIKNQTIIKKIYTKNQGSLEDRIENTFSDLNFKIWASKETLSDGNVLETEYSYAADKANASLISYNILSEPLDIRRLRNGRLINTQELEYANISGGLLLKAVSTTNYGDVQSIKKTVYEEYDNKGNPVQISPENGNPIVLIWGYNQSRIIAKIEGARSSEISQSIISPIVHLSNEDALDPEKEKSLIDALDAFRNNPAISKFLVSTYTYDPVVGITSITSADGQREIYHYDIDHRLEKVLNSDGVIIKTFRYNYSNTPKYYNTESVRNFAKDNCGISAIGGNYTYRVPAGKYISFISQADADQKAQNEINSNGQVAANENATCSQISCSLSLYNFNGGGSVYVSSNSFKATFGFSTGPYSASMPWTTGVKVATITGNCKPASDYSSYNGQVYYTVKANGDIILRSHNGAYPANTNLNFDIYFPSH